MGLFDYIGGDALALAFTAIRNSAKLVCLSSALIISGPGGLEPLGLSPLCCASNSFFLHCFANNKPQALQRVLGPVGPFLHSGVSVAEQQRQL
jgi:hypothetical protein